MSNYDFIDNKEELLKNFSRGFQNFLKRKKLDVKQIAKYLGVSESGAISWKYGRNFPDVTNLFKLIGLGLSPLEVMGDELRSLALINHFESSIEEEAKSLELVERLSYSNELGNVKKSIMDKMSEYSQKKQEYEERLKTLMSL